MPLSFSVVLRKLLFLFFAAALVAIGSVSQAQLLVNVGGALADPTASPLGDAPGAYLIYNTEHQQATTGDVQNYAGVTFSGITGSFNVGVGFSYQNEMNPFVTRPAFDRGDVIIAGTQSSFYEHIVGLDNRHIVGLDNRNGNAESYSLDLTGLPPNTEFTLSTYHYDANNQAATFTTDLTGDAVFQQHSATRLTFNDPLPRL